MIPKEKISVQNLINEEKNFCMEVSQSKKPDLSSWHSENSHSIPAYLQQAKLNEIRKIKSITRARNLEQREKLYAIPDNSIQENAKYVELPVQNKYLSNNILQKQCMPEYPKKCIRDEHILIGDFNTSVLQRNREFSEKLQLPKLNLSNNPQNYRSNSISFQRNTIELSHFSRKVPSTDYESKNKLSTGSIYPQNFYDKFFVEPSSTKALDTKKSLNHKSTITNSRLPDESSLRNDIKEFIRNIRFTIVKSKV